MLAERVVSHPRGWSVSPLRDFAVECKQRAGHDGADLPVLSVTKHYGIVRSDEFFSKPVHGKNTSNYKVVHPGQFAYATIHLNEGSVGNLRGTTPGIVSPMYTVFEINDRIDPSFLLAAMKSERSLRVYQRITQGTVDRRGGISFRALSELLLHYPPLTEQRKIAAILASVDAAAEKAQAVIDQVQVLKRGLMQDLLTRGLPGRHTRFKQTEIGTIPEEWGLETLDALVQGGTSITYGIVQPGPDVDDGVPYINTRDMTADEIRLRDLARTHPNIAAKYKRSEVRRGDLVFSIRASVGAVAEIPPQLDGVNLTRGTARISPSERVSSRFLLWALRGVAIQKWVALRTKGTTYREIALKTLKDVPTPVPTLDEQHALTRIFDSLDARESSEKRRWDQLLRLKSALMSSLLTGEIRVTPDSAAA